jgi:rRNA small subunit pseudouridine methyltransferase Nep1
MLNLIVADAELEQVPKEIANHRVVRWYARRRGRRPDEIILNSSLHHAAMLKLPDWDRRGRPDIVHMCLLLALDSPLNLEGLLRTYVHTRQDKVITVDPSARLPRIFYRFEGLLEQLFLVGKTPPQKPLLRLEDATLPELLRRLHPKKTITFSDMGEPKSIAGVYGGLKKEDDICAIVGGFPKGDFLSDVRGISDELICIDPEPLHAPTVVAKAIYAYEDVFGIGRTRLERARCLAEKTEDMAKSSRG